MCPFQAPQPFKYPEYQAVPKVGMEPIRRRQLIQATIASIHEYGFADTTIARIARSAGVSTGIVHHYFQGKADLLEATMRWLMTDLRRQVVDRLNRTSGPHERLAAIIDGNFAPGQFSAEAVAAWVAFWAHAKQTPTLGRLERINTRRLQGNLRHALVELMPRPRAAEMALGLSALIDGLSVRCALDSGDLTRAAAARIVHDYLAAELERRGAAAGVMKEVGT